MSLGGNTIARALAMVSVGTFAAFVHWGLFPPTLELADPGGGGPIAQGERPGGDLPPPGEGDGATGDPAGGQPDGPAGFDPTTLGTKIGTTDAHRLWMGGETAFIDARPQKDYVEGHIPFAYLVPAESIDHGRLGDLMEIAGVDSSWRVVVYCEGGTCDASQLVALTLQDMGFSMIHIDVDGYPAWEAAGHEVETGPDAVLGDVP